MPIYEYSCQNCKKDFEIFANINEEKPICPSCGSDKVSKKISKVSTKGSCSITPSGFS